MGKLILLSCLFFCPAFCLAQSGELDPSFGNHGIVVSDMGSPFDNNSTGRQVLIQPGGTIYIIFNNPTYVSKIFADGSIDSSYGFNGYSKSVSFNDAYAALQPDGKVVIAGSGFRVARINTNGMPDSTFGTNGIQTGFDLNSNASAVAIQNDGKIVVAGTRINSGDTYFALARYNINGSPDNTFSDTGRLITDFGFKIPPGMGGTDSIPIHVQSATTILIQPDGKIVAGGYVYTGVDNDFAIARYNTNGSPDSTFDNDGRQTTNFGSYDNGYSLAIQNDEKLILAGYTSVLPVNHFALARYNSNGSPDSTFNSNGKQTANIGSDAIIGNSVAIQSDGKIVVAGYTPNGIHNNDFAAARFNSDGSLDNTFDNDGILSTDFSSSDDYAGSVAIQSDDKILVAGYSIDYSTATTVQHLAVLRYNTDGSLDNTFADNGRLLGISKQGYTRFNTAAIQTDGKVVAAGLTWNGSNYDFAIARFDINGRPDSTFSDDGKQTTDFGGTDEAFSVAIQPDGKIVVAGNSNIQFAVARYNTDGSPDNTFSDDGKLTVSMGLSDVCRAVALQSDGKIVVTGYTFIDASFDSSVYATIRFNTDGTPDNTFSGDGKQLTDFGTYDGFARSVAIQNDGKIVVAGRAFLNNIDNFSVARYNIDGSLDTTFSHDGKQNSVFGINGDYGTSVIIQNDGKIIVAGYDEATFAGNSAFAVVRYKTNGDLDTTFSGDGFQNTNLGPDFNFGFSAALKGDGRIAVGGTNDNFAIVLYNSNGNRDSTFSQNGIQVTNIGIGGSSIQGLAFTQNKLYAAGNAQFPGTFGVIARYLITDIVLPVSLLDFKAVLQNKSVLLQWEIATEKNLTMFVIERSADGNRFLPINNITVTGGNTLTRDYSIIDNQPLQDINFYRLKMVDADGKFSYSNIVAVKVTEDHRLRIFPNPANRILFVEADGNNENATVQIMDAGGRKLREMKVFINGETSFSVDISNLPNGVYNLIVHKKEKTEVQTFIRK